MDIVCTFKSYDELVDFAQKILGETRPTKKVVYNSLDEMIEDSKKVSKIIDAAEAKEEKPAKKEPAKKEEKEEAPSQTVTETELKTLFASKIKAGKKEAIAQILGEFGVSKLSELVKKHPDKLSEAYAKAEVL